MRWIAALATLTVLGCVPSPERRSSNIRLRDAGFAVAPDAGVEEPPPGPEPDAGQVTPPPPVPDAGPVPPPPPRDAGVSTPDAGDQCVEGPTRTPAVRSNVYYGTAQPTYVTLTQGQIMAIGSFNGCSGCLVTQRFVLTAKHCGLNRGAEFCIGPQASNPNICFNATRVIDHPSGDMTLVELGVDASSQAPGVEPITLLSENLSSAWVGRTAEAAGYGQQENGGFNEREFTAEPISAIQGDTLTIDGEGRHGVCFGDSGGPVFVVASDGTTRVAGALSNGDESCVGQDNFTRVDTYRTWLEGYVGTIQPPGPQPCGTVTSRGSCAVGQGSATYCSNGELQVDTCPSGQACGWSAPAQGWRCVTPGNDACGGAPEIGRCAGQRLSWCDQGVRLERDCQACGETCTAASDQGFICSTSACGDLDFLGRCEGDVAVWCNRDGVPERRDCAAMGQSCGYVDSEVGYFCE